LVSLHAHNEAARIPEVLDRLAAGGTVAVASDAGTPGISDPGARLVAAAVGAGASVTAVPGPNAVLTALVVSGLPAERFCFEGFLPRRGAERRRRLEALAGEERTTVLYEAPGRVARLLEELAAGCGGGRRVAVARELTKLHEEVWRGTLADAAAAFGAREVLGEVVVVLAGADAEAPADDGTLEAALRGRLAAGDTLRDAAAVVAHAHGVPRRRVYELGLGLRARDAGRGR
jgi:16S rRNA (cytidine1402-2'-O)-methyltransferase